MVHEMRVVGEIARQLHRLPKPTLAVVDGVAVGVSLGLALACDLIIASDRARFSSIFVRRGLTLDGGTFLDPAARGRGSRRAKQIAFFGDMGQRRRRAVWGLINGSCPPMGSCRQPGWPGASGWPPPPPRTSA